MKVPGKFFALPHYCQNGSHQLAGHAKSHTMFDVRLTREVIVSCEPKIWVGCRLPAEAQIEFVRHVHNFMLA